MKAQSDLEVMYRKAGFTLVRAGRHLIWRCPCGHTQVVSACSLGRGRGDRNARGDMNRALKGCTPRTKAA